MAKKIKRDINDPIELEVLKQNAQLGNVPNVTTNNQTPTWSMSSVLSNIVSGETLTIIMGKISKVINDIISHIGNKNNPHSVTKSQVGLGNVENKSGTTIRSEMTKTEVINALGYTPPTTDTKYSVATSSTLGLIKSGTDITVDSNGNVSVNDDSHNHIISNIDNLQTVLDSKLAKSGGSLTGNIILHNVGGSWIIGKTQAPIIVGGESTVDEGIYSPIIMGKTTSGDVWNLGHGAYDQVGFFGFYNERTDNGTDWKHYIKISDGTVHFGKTVYGTTFSGSFSGNSTSATKLVTARKIAGASFDGTADISISYNNLTDKPTIPSGVQVIDNLTSSSTTASLSANQGRIVKGYLDKKVVVSSTQPSGQQTGDTWYQII